MIDSPESAKARVPAAPYGQARLVYAASMMIGASALIAVTTLLAKALGQGLNGPPLHALQVSASRFAFALLTLLTLVPVFRPRFRGAAWGVHAARSFCGWSGITCLFAAAALMPLAEATAIGYLSPLATMMLAIPFLGERVSLGRWAAAAVSVVGAVVLIRPGTEAFQPAALVALAAAALLGLEAIFIKILSDREPPIRILLINNTIGMAMSAIAASFVWVAPSPTQWVMLAGVGIAMVSAQALFIQAMKHGDASYVAPFFYATLVFAALYDLLAFAVWPATISLVGAGLIVAGAILLALQENKRRAGA